MIRPLVLLPAGSLAVMSPAEFQAVAAHELVHIRRGDFLRNLLYELLVLPASYHPLLWLTREQMAQTREMICDRMAAQSSGRRQYTRALLRLASLLMQGQPLRTPYAVGIFDTKTLERRVMSLTEETREVGVLRRLTLAATCAALLTVTCGTALALRAHVDGLAHVGDHPSTRPTGPGPIKPEVMAKRRINGPMPKYPEAAKKAGIEGTVLLDAVIGKDGSVEQLKVASGPKQLQSSSLEAVRQWKYQPYLLNGEPIEVQTTIKVVYSLAKKDADGK
jgi:TonB family protein